MYFATTVDWSEQKLTGSGKIDKEKFTIGGGKALKDDKKLSFKIFFENKDARSLSTLPKEGEPIPAELLAKSYDVTCIIDYKTLQCNGTMTQATPALPAAKAVEENFSMTFK